MQVTKEYVILRYARSVFGNFVQGADIISIATKEIITATTAMPMYIQIYASKGVIIIAYVSFLLGMACIM